MSSPSAPNAQHEKCLRLLSSTHYIAEKKKWWQFLLMEFLTYFCQCIIFLIMFTLAAFFNADKNQISRIAADKITVATLLEFLYLLVGIVLVIGCIAFINYIKNGNASQGLIGEIIAEIPKTAYVFGASFSAISLIFAFTQSAPISKDYYIISACSAAIGYILGASLSYLIKRKSYIK